MSLRKKVVLVLGVAFGLAMIAIVALTRGLVLGGFQKLENRYAVTNVDRAWAALNNEIARQVIFVRDWGRWDDTRDFVLGKRPEYAAANLSDSSVVTLQVNLMTFWNADRQCVANKGVDLKEKTDWPVPKAIIKAISERTELFAFSSPTDSASGIVRTEIGPILLASCPITNNDNTMPIHGVLVVGRLLDESLVNKLAQQTQLELCLLGRSGETEVAPESVVRSLSDSDPMIIQIEDSQHIHGYHLISDLAKQNDLVLQVSVPRDIIHQGRSSVLYFLASLGWVGILVGGTLWILLRRLVLNPVHRLADHVVTIAKTGDLTARLEIRSEDEMGTLTRQFNALTEQLHQARKELTDQAFLSGMSEMASGVLHNLRNALTPITTEIESLCREVEQVPVQHLQQAIAEMALPMTEPLRREKLVQFVNSGRDNLIELVGRIHGRLEGINRPMAHVDQILADQQQYCSNPAAQEAVTPAELIEDARTLIGVELLRPAEIVIDPSLKTAEAISVPRIQMLQVISNLLINAAESIRMTGRPRGQITFAATVETGDWGKTFHLRVQDDGNGFTPEIQKRLFERGYSTKGKSNWGLGLHWCSNVLGALHGRIYAESEGQGKGATFHVEWPLA
jgi:two-component system NtrC family sensor kinase